MEFDITQIILHPKFNIRNLQNDIAILQVDTQVPLGLLPSIAPACLPDSPINQSITCFVSGWGRNDFDYGTNQAIQRKVDVPIVDNAACQAILRMTRLGKNFILDPGFMCAGGIQGKDAVSLFRYSKCDRKLSGCPLLIQVHWWWWSSSCLQNSQSVVRCWYVNLKLQS